ncbi:unnamed protein product [Amoebophrya sp. A120]|nr:unnamed protein product [Amoebophrya sp. A120]|eukprot:GSA120T00015355001.1
MEMKSRNFAAKILPCRFCLRSRNFAASRSDDEMGAPLPPVAFKNPGCACLLQNFHKVAKTRASYHAPYTQRANENHWEEIADSTL